MRNIAIFITAMTFALYGIIISETRLFNSGFVTTPDEIKSYLAADCFNTFEAGTNNTQSLIASGSKDEPYILTPKSAPSPRINGAKVFGARPGNPFLFTIAATGDRPMKFSAKSLPEGVKLDEQNGIITGAAKKEGTYKVTLKAQNSLGSTEREFRIIIGDKICLTPPMGWNSWYSWSESVSDEKMRHLAKAFVDKGLINHGWSYVNIDGCWQGFRGGKFTAIQGNERFPDMKSLCDYIHSLGLKTGIYSSPCITDPDGFLGLSSDNADASYENFAIPLADRPQPHQILGRCPNPWKKGYYRVGKYWFGDSDAKQWTEWGFDYIKYDWLRVDIPTIMQIKKDISACKRDIVISISSGIPYENASVISTVANIWRTTSDIQANWKAVSEIGFDQDKWREFAGPGHWNDPDMLQIGMIGVPNTFVRTLRPTKLTPDEQYSHVSLWCLLAAPLLLSCDLENIDDFTLNLITNDEVIDVNQDPLGKQAKRIIQNGQKEVWVKDMEDGSRAVGLFNRDAQPVNIKVKWSDIGINGKKKVRDLWRQKDLGVFTDEFEAMVPAHGVILVRIMSGVARFTKEGI